VSARDLQRLLEHPDPPQLWYQLEEIVVSRIYLQEGVQVRPGDVVLDVGANIGVAAAFFAAECGAEAVHCFEPVRPIFEQLQRNLRHFPACIPHPYGLSYRSRSTTITYYPRDWAISGLYAEPVAEREMLRRALLNLGNTEEEADERLRDRFASEELPCELRTLSDALRSESIERVDLLKIDVEKAELDVLAGIADADWPRIRQLVMELHLDSERRERAASTIRARGFDVTVRQDPTMAGTDIHMVYAVRPASGGIPRISDRAGSVDP
jgi:FkbM family methyltransferase